jgi:hypothetical protein
VAIPSSLAAPASISNSYRRPRAIAVTSFLRVRLLARAHSGNRPFGWDGVWRRYNRSPAMDRKPAGQDSTELFAPGTVTVPAPFAAESQFLSGSSCCWFQAERIMVRSASRPNGKGWFGVGLEIDTSRFESSEPSQPPGSLAAVPRHSENWPHFRTLATKSPVSGQRYRTSRAEYREFGGVSLLDEFSISEIQERWAARRVSTPGGNGVQAASLVA